MELLHLSRDTLCSTRKSAKKWYLFIYFSSMSSHWKICFVKMHHATLVPVESPPPSPSLHLVALRPSTFTWLLGDVVHVAESKCHLPSYFHSHQKHTVFYIYINIVSIWMRSFNKNNPYTYTSRQMAQKNRPNKGHKWSQSPFKNASNTPRCNTNCQVHRKFDFWDQQSIPYFPPRWYVNERTWYA